MAMHAQEELETRKKDSIHIHNLPREKKTKNDAAQLAALDALRSRANVLPPTNDNPENDIPSRGWLCVLMM